MQRLIDWWFGPSYDQQPRHHQVRTRDGWRLALYRYRPPNARRTPVLLCHGMASNRWNVDGPGRLSLARHLAAHGHDVWIVELRGAGRSTRPSCWNRKRYDWTFEDYVHHDAPAALRTVLQETGADQVHWVGHSMGGMIAYALLMGPIQHKIASVVTLASPTMSDVGHPMLDIGIPYRSALNYFPARLPLGTLGRLGAPLAPLLARLLTPTIAELGWCPGNADAALLRTLMLTAVDDVPATLLQEFARWYEGKAMSDRYEMFDFTDHLERITRPILIIAGNKDGLTPPRDLEHVYRRIASSDKTFRVIGRDHGFRHDYSHVDLVLGLYAPDEVYPIVVDWLDRHGGTVDKRRRAASARGKGTTATRS